MKHPAYHLRPNKAVDRVLLAEIIEHAEPEWSFSKSTYYGLGGPLLEDVRVLSDCFPSMRFVCIEKDAETHKRQHFHKSTKHVRLVHSDVNSYLNQEFPSDKCCIFWLVGLPSIVKVTVPARLANVRDAPEEDSCQRCYWKPNDKEVEKLHRSFNDYLPFDFSASDLSPRKIVRLILSMFQLAAQRALPSRAENAFQLIHSCIYADGPHPMLSMTGMVCKVSDGEKIAKHFGSWRHAATNWQEIPQRVDVPDLSVKERLFLEKHLPSPAGTGKALRRVLGYDIDNSQEASERKLLQYQEFYRFYPLFTKVRI